MTLLVSQITAYRNSQSDISLITHFVTLYLTECLLGMTVKELAKDILDLLYHANDLLLIFKDILTPVERDLRI